jgi:DNA-directed RNA polymerase subunit RPC12/RpoP
MSISFTCTSCSKSLAVKDEFAGKKIKCPGCQAVLVVPAADTSKKAEAPKTAAPSNTPHTCTVRCEECGSTFSDIAWKPDMPCIGCGSTKFFPMTEEDEEQAAQTASAIKTSFSTMRKPAKVKISSGGGGWKKSPIVAVILIVAILGLWVKIGVNMAGGGGERPQIDMMCEECSHELRDDIPEGKQPWKCPECGERALYTAMKCEKGHHFPVKHPVIPEVSAPCPECGKDMIVDQSDFGGGMLVCPDQFTADGTPGCSGHMRIATYYCYGDGHVWSVLPNQNGKLVAPTKCPNCGSKEICNFYEYHPYCPECKSTHLQPITPFKRKKK